MRAWFSHASLARRLTLGALLTSFTVLLAAGFILAKIHRQATERAFDERLSVYLHALSGSLASPIDQDRSDPSDLGDPKFDLPMSGWYWQIEPGPAGQGDMIASPSLFGARLTRIVDPQSRADQPGVVQGYMAGPDERRLRAIERSVQTPDQVWHRIRVAGDADEIEQAVRAFRLPLVVTLVVLGCLIALLTGVQVTLGLKPLQRVQAGLASIRAGQSDQIAGTFPPDLAPLVRELNLLLDANREITERARTQAGNLAHALKTPLSVINNELQGLADAQTADRLRDQIHQINTQLQWHLERARQSAMTSAIGRATDMAPVFAGLERVFAKLWQERGKDGQGLQLIVDVEAGLQFRGEKPDLEDMVGNLMDNAGKWAAGLVHVRVCRPVMRPLFAEIIIDDDGPGLPEAQRAEALKRGLRLDETRPGSGLGLAIVSDLAKLYGGSLALETSPSGGLRARLDLPIVET
jgi:signal transduction histidine kinase